MPAMDIKTTVRTEMINITRDIERMLSDSNIKNGLCHIFVPHTTAGITINEGADPSVAEDIVSAFKKLIPWEGGYRHLEGNSAAHIKTSLVGSSDIVAVEDGRLQLGTWQAVFFCEFDGPRTRKVQVRFFD
ncbi:MAG: secondary thiamine-phosphate synthase enzyme YjbQ [Deltaproteobacteria bacterium]|jgi:secondary thiamine-phosphate synthase enzyme|nr:secondary thiamine-phosphate synthase enzyme YjbQ [Deltaproteobacteria bacterium]